MRYVLLVLVFAPLAAFGGVGAHFLILRHSGEPATATVQECELRIVGGERDYVCRGSWVGSGQVAGTGVIINAGYRDVGKTVEVRVHGDKAYWIDAWSPLVAIGAGIALTAFFGWLLRVFWRDL